ncbi:phage tail length tape measure family protein [Acidovorax sp. NCPPB 4044]|uniref:phage tail length tape measure family protein n=1 Tax=Acidovorax sp. NCPPB 4044 TaxID=2940490 RepID=UPI0023025173|nr:phage tail length tape measure family protein [Acidovorax sp. NCPPB 4044]MDA8521974.1 phage tail length tape measure family protein [Acidovorax sp. NCPPB 4044]
MSDLKVQGEFDMDVTKGEQALARVETGARKMASTVKQAGDTAAQSLESLGGKADQSAKAMERANASLATAAKRAIAEQQRAIVEAQGYSLKSVEGLEQLARMRGADAGAIAGQLDALRLLRAEQERMLAVQREAAGAALFEQQHAAAKKLVQDAEYVRIWTAALDQLEAKQREIAALPAFEREQEAAIQAKRRADATYALTQALDIQEARERELAAVPAFEREREAAAQARRRADAVSALTQVLDQQEAAERKLAAQNSFLTSLQGQADSIGKTRSELLAMQAAQLGVSDKAAPMIARLREQEQGLGKVGISAGQTAAALRGLPAQFTDIVVSLQGGQAPLTVFLQQGGQIKDQFGGAGNAVRAMAGYLLRLINPVTLAAAGFAALGYAMYKAEESLRSSNGIAVQLEATGRAAELTRADIKALQRDLMLLPDVSKTVAKAVIGEFLQTREVGGQLFKDLALSVADFAAATGTTAPKAAKVLAEAFNDPAKGAKQLDEALNILTASQMLAIEAMLKMGDKAGAQAVLLDALKASTQGLAQEAMTPLQSSVNELGNAWNTMTSKVGDAKPFRAANELLAGLISKVASLIEWLGKVRPPAWLEEQFKGGLNGMVYRSFAAQPASTGGASGSWGDNTGGATGSFAPARVPAVTGLDDQVKAAMEAAKGYKSLASSMADVRAHGDLLRTTLKALEDAGKGNSAEAKNLRASLDGVNERLVSMGKKAGAGARVEQTAYETLIASIKTKIAQNDEELRYSGRLTESDKLRLQMQAQLEAGSKKLTAAHKADALALLEKLEAQEKEKEAIKRAQALYQEQVAIQEELDAAYVAESRARESGRQAVTDYVKGIEESTEALQFELSIMGMSEKARAVALEQYRIELDLKKQIAAVNRNEGFNQTQRDEEIARLQAGAAIAKANASSKAFLEEWKTSVKQYDDIFRQGFADMLNSGRDGWKSFTRSLVTTFKTTVADQIYKMFAQPFVVRIVGQLMGVLGGGGGSTASALSGNSMGTGSLSWFTNFGGNAGNLINNVGGRLFDSGLETFGGMLIDNSAVIGRGLEAVGEGLGYLNSVIAITKGKWGEGIGSAIGTYFGGPIGAVIGSTIGKWIDKAFSGETRTGGQFAVAFDGSVTNNRRGQTYTYEGQQYDRDFSGGNRTALTNGQAYRLEGDPVDAAQEDAIRKAIAGTATGINDMLKQLGSAVTLTGFWAGLETSTKGRGGNFTGGSLSNGAIFGESGKGDNYAGTLYEKFSTNSPDFKTALENFTLDLKQSAIQALQSVTDIPETVKRMVDGVDAEALSADAVDALLTSINVQIAGVSNFKLALDAMGLDSLADLSFDAAAGIAQLSGGFDKLQTNLGSYYEKFFSDDERRANLKRQVEEQLGSLDIKLPDIDATDARAQYRGLVEAQDLSTEAGRKAYAVLLQLAGAFDSIAVAAENSGTAAEEAARKQEEAARKLQEITDKGRDLEQRLLIAQGKDREALDLRRLQEYYALLNLNPELARMVIEIYKAEDAAEALANAQRARETAYTRLQNAVTLETEKLNAQLEAVDAQRTAINTQRELAQESLSLITGVFDLVRSNARELYGQVESTATMQAAQGWAFVEQALAAARTTGYLPEQAALQEAIGAARGGLDAGQYATQFEADRDKLVLAGMLSGIEAVSGKQKTAAEQQLEALEAQGKALDLQTETINRQLKAQQEMLDYWRRQIDIANGTFDATLSVADAIDRLAESLGATNQVKPEKLGSAAAWGGSSGGAGAGAGAAAEAKYRRVMSLGTAGVGYEAVIDQALIAKLDALAPLYHSYDGTGNLLGLLTAIKAAGGTLDDLSILSGYFVSDWMKAAASVGIPAFASGGSHAGGWAVVGERGPELAYMPPARIYNAVDTRALLAAGGGSDQAELVAEVRALRQEVAALRAAGERTADNTAPLPAMAEQIEQVTEGGNVMRVEVMA